MKKLGAENIYINDKKSIVNYIDNLYVFKVCEWRIMIPQTINSFESLFWRLRQRIRIHRYLK